LRVTATGQLYPCLGGAEQVDLRSALRSDAPQRELAKALEEAMTIKPERHHFRMDERGADPALAEGVASQLTEDRVNVACGGKVLADKTTLAAQNGDEVALLPPVSGG